jgi:riboflavin transporter FmnP
MDNVGVVIALAMTACIYLDKGLRTIVEDQIGIPPAFVAAVGVICLVAVIYGNRKHSKT